MTAISAIFIMLALAAVNAFAVDAWPSSPEEIKSFLDSVMSEGMREQCAPGAVISVVNRDRILFSAGYGAKALDENTPPNPATTKFRLASVSKLFTATVVMQLFEQKKLDLDTDVNVYLSDFKLPSIYERPVTLTNLLTHTGGFDDRFLSMAAPSMETLKPLGKYLSIRMPPRVMPPGRSMSYSNHGVALAGYVVECVSGEPFPDYVRKHIFEPLRMTNSSFAYSPGPGDDLAKGYTYYFGKHHQAPFDYPETVPASSLVSTADDMARFMIAHLQLGRFENTSILREETASFMHEQHFSQKEGWPGMAYGFEEDIKNGHRILEHSGLILGYSSLLILIPDSDAGIFVSVTRDNCSLCSYVANKFFDHFFPERPTEAQAPPPGSDARIKKVLGAYRNNRYCRTTFFKLGVMIPTFVPEAHITRGQNPGTISLSFNWRNVPPLELTEVEPFCFQSERREDGKTFLTDKRRLSFRIDDKGYAVEMFFTGAAYDRLPWWSRQTTLGFAAATSILIFLIVIIAAIVSIVLRRRVQWSPQFIALLASSKLNMAFVIGMALFIVTLHVEQLGYGAPPFLIALLTLPLLSCVSTTTLIILTARQWFLGQGSFFERMAYGLGMAAVALFIALLHYWNLLGYRFG
jgi:CubicO group peptidase (beta-lactamase class C family)